MTLCATVFGDEQINRRGLGRRRDRRFSTILVATI
jgi:hypothetical protein